MGFSSGSVEKNLQVWHAMGSQRVEHDLTTKQLHYLFIYLSVSGLSRSTPDIWVQHAGSVVMGLVAPRHVGS